MIPRESVFSSIRNEQNTIFTVRLPFDWGSERGLERESSAIVCM